MLLSTTRSVMRAAGQSVPDELAALARTTVEDAVAEFVTHLELTAHEHRESYVARYKTDLNLYVTPKSEDEIREAEKRERRLWQPNWTFLDEITSARWDEERLRLHKKNGGLLGARSIQHLANTLRHLLRFGVTKGWIESVPELKAPSQRQVKAEKKPRRAMSVVEREKFLKALAKYDPRGNAHTLPAGTAARFYEALFFSLMRRGEMFAITQRWIDRRAKVIRIPATDSKSGEAETAPLHPRALKALSGQILVRGGLEPDEPIFGEINVRPAYEFALTTARIDPYSVTPHHTTRHTGATILAEKTKDREALKHAGRWRSNIVDDYIHSGAERARPLIAKL